MDIKTDKIEEKPGLMDEPIRVETHRSGIFVFQIGVDFDALQPLIDRVEDAHRRFSSAPILPNVAMKLEKEAVVSSIFGTNTIEGATLTEQETASAFNLTAEQIKNENELRVVNIRSAYEKAEALAKSLLDDPGLEGRGVVVSLREDLVRDLHKRITNGLSHPRNIPGEYRNNQKGEVTKVGDTPHGGIYTPPKSRKDIELVMKAFVEWVNSDPITDLSPLIRAPLVHYYFERIHPFWDGNGRVGRVLEAIILKCAGYKYAPFALSRYYLENLDTYFTVFNLARKAEEKGEGYPNAVFMEFFLKGMLTVLNRLHDKVNALVGLVLFQSQIQSALAEKEINVRQFTILSNLLVKGYVHNLSEVQSELWYQALYKKLTAKTRSRDMQKLEDAGFVKIKNKQLLLEVPGTSE